MKGVGMHKDAAEWFRLNTQEGLSFTAIAKRFNLKDRSGKPRRGLVAGAIREYKRTQHRTPQPEDALPAEPGMKDTETDNTREVQHTGRIISLDQLLERARVDMSVWAVQRHVINKWELGRKDIHKRIDWEDGVANGFVEDTGGVNVEPLYQVKVFLVRREPIAIKPVLRPININLKLPAMQQERKRRGMKAAVLGADAHFGFQRDWRTGKLEPFHDRQSLSILLQLIAAVEPDWSILAGDWLDYANWSEKFAKEPQFVNTTQPALNEAAYVAARVSAASGKTTMLEGNHDLRPERAIRANVLESYGLCAVDNLDLPVYSVPNLLGLNKRGIEYVGGYPDGAIWLNDTTRITHGMTVRGKPGATAGAVVQESNETVGFGHIHRRESASRTIRERSGYRTITAFCPGCLCHIDGRVPGSKASDQWQQGAAVIWYDDERATVVPVEIENGQAVYNGEVFAGADYAVELRAEFEGWGF
jgi:hypothetical protein